MTNSEKAFDEWFSKNYSKDTIIHDPHWHSPKILKAAKHALSLDTHPQPDSKLVEENARLRDALDACLLMCDFSSIPAIEKSAREALNK